MSAPVAAEVLRELGAEKRTFRTPRHVLLWYQEQLAARLRVNRDPASVGTPSNRRARDQREATFAAIGVCLAERHDSDADLPESLVDALPMRGERLVYLAAWYENTYGNGGDLAMRWNPRGDNPRWAFMRWCRITERILRHRFTAAGLIEESDG